MDRFVRLVTARPWLTVGAVLAVTLLAALQVVDPRSGELRLRIDPSVERLLPRGDETRLLYEEVREIFGNDQHMIVALAAESAFSADMLRRVLRLTERLEALEGVDRVVSLTTALDIRGVDDVLSIAPFVEEVPEDPAALAAIRRHVQESAVYARVLASEDGRATSLLVYLDDIPEAEFRSSGLDARIAEVAREEAGDAAEVWIGGSPHSKQATSQLLLSDVSRVIPIGAALLGLTALVAFRTLRGTLVPLLTIAIANIWTVGSMAALGVPLNLVTIVVPALVQTVGFAYAIHVVSHAYDLLKHGEAAPDQIGARALRELALPLALTAFTTAAGLSTLTVSPMLAVREFGIFSVLGVLYTSLAAATFTPAALQIGRPRAPGSSGSDGFDRLAERLGHFDIERRRAIFVGAALLACLALVGVSRIQINTDFVTNFRLDHPVRRDAEAINRWLGGVGTFDVVIEAEEADAFKEPRKLRALEELQRWLEEQPEVGATNSLADYVKSIHWGMHDNDPGRRRIPETREMVSQLLLFGANDELDLVIDPGYQLANVRLRSRTLDSQGASQLLARIEERLQELPGDLHGRVTGDGALLARAVDDIARTQARSLVLAFGVIYLVLAGLLTSFRVGAVALVPNALPVLFYFGLLGWSGVTLNATTGLIACLALGIAVDDTIHFFARFNREAHALGDERRASLETLRSVGRPVTITSLALCLGFLVLMTAELKNQAEFGMMTAATLAFAWWADVMVTPALCSGLRVVTLWDTLSLDLGADPTRTIPLFEGLSTRQAKITCLMGSLGRYAAGDKVFRTGESGDELLVVIDGELRASLQRPGGDVILDTHRRGDVVGEVALQTGHRTADVEALHDARVLRLSRDSLDRLARRSPRIAAQVYRNLNRILGERLARQTQRL